MLCGAQEDRRKFINLPEFFLVVNDWTNQMALNFATGLRSTALAANSLLVDGHGNWTNPATGVSTNTPLAVVYCQKDKRHRFRFVFAGSQNCPIEICVS